MKGHNVARPDAQVVPTAVQDFNNTLQIIRDRSSELQAASENDHRVLRQILAPAVVKGSLDINVDRFLSSLSVQKLFTEKIILEDGKSERDILGSELAQILLDRLSTAFSTALAQAAQASNGLIIHLPILKVLWLTFSPHTGTSEKQTTNQAADANKSEQLVQVPHPSKKDVIVLDGDEEGNEVTFAHQPQVKEHTLDIKVPQPAVIAQLKKMTLFDINVHLLEAIDLERGTRSQRLELSTYVVVIKCNPDGLRLRTGTLADHQLLLAQPNWLGRFSDILNGIGKTHIVIMEGVPLTGMGDLKIPLVKQAVIRLLYDLNRQRLHAWQSVDVLKDIYWNGDRSNATILREGTVTLEFGK